MLTREEFFKAAMKAKNYERRDWIISVLAESFNEPEEYPYNIERLDNGTIRVFMPEGDKQDLEGNYKDRPLFVPQDRVTLNVGDLPIVKKKVETSYYEAIFNACLFIYAFGDKVEYHASKTHLDVGKLEKELSSKIVDEPKTQEEKEKIDAEGLITTTEWQRCGEAADFLKGICLVVAPSGSKKTFTVDPAIIKRREELYQEYEGQLDDPAILAKIQKELVDMDKESFKGDPSERFFIKPGKQFGVARKKLHIMVGREEGFGATGEGKGTILHSLTEPKTASDLVVMNNSMRSGSYSRGKETELGGEIVNLINKAFQNTTISIDDCKSTEGLEWDVTKDVAPYLIGAYQISGKETIEITDDNIGSLIGKSIVTRSPLACRAKVPTLCATCMGSKYGKNPRGLVSAASSLPSAIMYIFMKAFHGKDLKTNKLVLADVVS